MHYYKRNIGDYHKKAGRLSMLQHGSYTLLIDSCYDREVFPTLSDAIDWTWASTQEEIDAVEFVLKRFFTLIDGVYVQNRIKEDLDAYHEKALKNKQIAIDREAKRKGKSTNRERTVNETSPNHKPLTTNHKPLNISKDLSSQPTADPMSSNVIDVFEFWKSTMEKTGATKLDSKRKSKIEQRLKDGYTVEQIKQAIVNCSKTPHNMGHNDRGQKYNDIELICRDAANLERFIESKPETAGQQTQHDDTSWGQSMAQPYIPNQQKVLGHE